MGVYLDLVVLLNFLVDLLLILAANRLAGYPTGLGRGIGAAALGGVYSGWCMIPGFRFLGNTLWRVVVLGIMAVIAFGWNRSAVQRGAVFLLLSMALGGIAVGFGKGSFGTLLAAAWVVWLLCRISFRGNVGSREYLPVELSWEGKRMSLIALRDTGNTLRDPLTGRPVLVAGADVAWELLGLTQQQLEHPLETMASAKIAGMRLIPYNSVGQPGSLLLAVIIPVVKVEKYTGKYLVAFAPQELGRGEVYRMLAGGTV